MGKAIHGRCRRGIRAAVGLVGRPEADRGETRQRFWSAVAKGMSTEIAAVAAGVSPPVGVR